LNRYRVLVPLCCTTVTLVDILFDVLDTRQRYHAKSVAQR
jgi:hypothetical protein